ncbi:DET1 homolog isoform X1 [Cylas formicarius]|uniref:DET1 homolog isoform X1 n=2 Tax=Cylas formicarius TaxID=197179 RepID=UPI00295896E1|nr:DET1 homolog isoform X1 [Cylas formicarius]
MDFLKRKKKVPQNIVIRLLNRQIRACWKPGTQLHTARQFYQNIFPNYTVINVERPPCFLRKFSPDGKCFIAFSADQTSLEVYSYQGPAAACDLIRSMQEEENDIIKKKFQIKKDIFQRFFKLKFVINITRSEQLNRECSLFSDDGRYVIVGSASFIPDEIRPHFYEIYTNNESVTPNIRSLLEDYTLHLVDLHLGKLCDTRQFKVDKIFLSHNQGLYLYKDILAVLSVQHQMIHIYQILDGMLIDVRKIGRFCYEDDLYLYSLVYPSERAFKDIFINSLKHRLLTFLYKRADKISKSSADPTEVRKFFHYFNNFLSLKMWKMQLLDENHLLIKYASEEVITLKQIDPNSEQQFFVVYNILDSKIIAVYENSSMELLKLYENFTDSFRNACLFSETQFTCNPSNNLYARLHHTRFKHTLTIAKFGGKAEAVRRILAHLPISAQSYTSSPYLDYSLFSYDDKWISVMERPKPCGEHPIRFNSRDSGYLKFRLYVDTQRNPISTARRLVAFTFHPTDPFAISVQRTNSEYIVNFHIRNDNCKSEYDFDDSNGNVNFI